MASVNLESDTRLLIVPEHAASSSEASCQAFVLGSPSMSY